MFSVLVLALALAASGDDAAGSTSKQDLADYQAARANAGKNAPDQVRLVLWCEAHGLSAERIKHLALAIAYDPSSALCAGSWGWSPTRASGRAPTR